MEEYYGLLAIKLCEVVMVWDKSKSKLSTLFYLSADRMIWNIYRKERTKFKQTGYIESLDYQFINKCGENNLMDILSNEGDELEDEVVESIVEEQLLNGKYRDVIELRLKGYNQSEISEILKTSQSNISRILKLVYEEYKMGVGE